MDDVKAAAPALRDPATRTARLVVEPLRVDWTPAEAALALRGDSRPVVLSGAWADGATILASEPLRVAQPGEDPFALLDDLPAVDGAVEAPPGAVGGGWFGYLGFALGHLVERLPPPPPARTGLPPFALAYYDHVLRRDAEGGWWFEALETPERAEALSRRRTQLAARTPSQRPFRAGPFAPAPPGTAGLRDAVGECVERIAAGELFQANLTLRIEGGFEGDPLDAFAAGLALRAAVRGARRGAVGRDRWAVPRALPAAAGARGPDPPHQGDAPARSAATRTMPRARSSSARRRTTPRT